MTTLDNESMPWIEKYRPRRLKDVIQDQYLLDLFENCTKKMDIPHFLFYGPPGTGKTSTILALAREIFKDKFNDRVIEFNASDDRGINAVREKITGEAKKYVTDMLLTDGTKIP